MLFVVCVGVLATVLVLRPSTCCIVCCLCWCVSDSIGAENEYMLCCLLFVLVC